jgi:hypothetical protein
MLEKRMLASLFPDLVERQRPRGTALFAHHGVGHVGLGLPAVVS